VSDLVAECARIDGADHLVPVSLVFHGDFVPDGLTNGAGLTQPIMSASFAGGLVLLPAPA
jgi:hypothetical protein